MKVAIGLLLTTITIAGATRNVVWKWDASPTAAIVPITYNLMRCTVITPSVTCVPTTLINASPITTTDFTDTTAVIGQTYLYGVEAVAPACVSTNPAPCGISALLEALEPITIPPKPAPPPANATINITVTGHGIVAVIE